MAVSAASTALTVSGSTSLDMSTLSSKSAFGSSCRAMQAAPVSRRAVRSGVVMASVGSEEAKPARREVLAGILAAGAALGFSGQANAAMNPVAAAKSKAGQAVQGAKDLAGSNPLEGVVGSNPLGDAQSTVEEVASGIKGRIDGLFGKDKPYPKRNTQVTGNGPVADAKARVGNFLDNSQNPLATNIEKAAKESESGLAVATGPNSPSARAGKEFLGQDSTRVDEATARVNAGAEKLQGKAVQAVDDLKGAVGTAKDAAPDVKVEAPGSGLLKSFGSKVDAVKGNVASMAEDAKSTAGGAASNVLGQ